MVTKIELPQYDPEKHPTTEALLALYDMATRWAEESGLPHRDLFRFACQMAEDSARVKKLEKELAQWEEKLAESRRDLVQYEALSKGIAYQG